MESPPSPRAPAVGSNPKTEADRSAGILADDASILHFSDEKLGQPALERL